MSDVSQAWKLFHILFLKNPPKPSKQLASMQTVKNSCTEFPVQMPFFKFIIRTWNIIWAWNFYNNYNYTFAPIIAVHVSFLKLPYIINVEGWSEIIRTISIKSKLSVVSLQTIIY